MTVLRVLIIEDSEDDTTLLLRELKRGGYAVVSERVDTPEAMRAALAAQIWDVVISDYSMPAFSAPAALAILHEVGLDLPFIISSGTVGEETAVTALRAGAHDFFVKGNLTRLIPAVERELREAQIRSERRQMTEELVALYNATSGLFKANNLVSLGQEIVRAVVKEFRPVDCGLLLLDKDRNHIIRIARAGNYEVQTTAALFANGAGLVPEAIRNAETIYSAEVSTDSRYLSNTPGTQSELVIPLQTATGILGVLDLQSPQPHAFTERDQRILNAFAERAAAAIEIRQLYEAINGYANELETRVTTRTAELHRAKEHVEAILNNSSDAIILAQADGKIRQINPAFYHLFGYDVDNMDAIIGQPLTSLIQADYIKRFTEAFQDVLVKKQPERIELIGRQQNKTTFPFEIALAPFEEDEAGVICSLRDITARKQLEQELREALEKEKELNDLKSRFSSMVSHEFRTPLATIQASSDLLMHYQHRLNDERKLEHLDAIQIQVKRMTGLLDEILLISRAETIGLEFNPEQVDLYLFCQNIVQEFQMIATSHRIEFSIAGDYLHTSIDPKLLRQALANLLLNAIKYSAAGTTIHLSLSSEREQAIIRLADQGIGIPEPDQKALFETFYRATNVGAIQGTGLGLAIVKQAVEAHGGTIQVESKVGVGTTFTIVLPRLPLH